MFELFNFSSIFPGGSAPSAPRGLCADAHGYVFRCRVQLGSCAVNKALLDGGRHAGVGGTACRAVHDYGLTGRLTRATQLAVNKLATRVLAGRLRGRKRRGWSTRSIKHQASTCTAACRQCANDR